MRSRTSAGRLLTTALLAAGVAAGCGDDTAIPAADRDALEGRLIERLDATEAEAACISGYLVEDYTPGQVQVVYDVGIEALPQGLWDRYFTATFACLTTDTPAP